MKIKLTWRIWLLIIAILFSLLSVFITPTFLQQGVLITSVETNSTALIQGFKQGQVITEIDNQKITSVEDYSNILQDKYQTNESVKVIFKTTDLEIVFFSNMPHKITVEPIKNTNLKLGLDLEGGSKGLIKAQDKKLTQIEAQDLAEIIKNRLNVYGIEDLNVMPISDLSGEHYVRIEIAGATPEDLRNLISEQGKFEAKIGDEIVFIGGERDITSVARTGQDVEISCFGNDDEGHICNFRFTIYLSEDAANRHAEVTKDLGVNSTPQGNYLDEKLDLFLDDKLVDSLLISEDLKARVTTQISIQGSGTGETQEDAYNNAQDEMHQLQTVLKTGSLPYKLEIVKLDTISSTLGKEFTQSIFLAGFVALLAVSIIVFVRYKKIKSSIALLFTSMSEILIILGIASLISWNLDLPSIAGILATIGTGIDSQIIILDEAKEEKLISMKQRMKRAFAIILGAYFTAIVALFPLYWAAAGFFKGFAITTMIGITIGVLITRPAFSDMVRRIEE